MRSRATLIIAALALGVVPLLAPSTASAAGLPTTVSIQVSLVYSGQARTFSVTDATVGAGPELTIANQTANPNFCGYVDVDIDNQAETITVTGHEPECSYDTATITITGTGIDTITEVSDGAFAPDGDCSFDSSATITSPGVAGLLWDGGECGLVSTEGGVSSYTYSATTPTTPTTAGPTTTSSSVPPTSTTAAPAVAAVEVTPAFTG